MQSKRINWKFKKMPEPKDTGEQPRICYADGPVRKKVNVDTSQNSPFPQHKKSKN
jgi:hypothetical protein